MNKELKDIISALRDDKNPVTQKDFFFRSKDKEFNAKISIENDVPRFEITDLKGYNSSYINKKLRRELFAAFYIPIPVEGSIIRVAIDPFVNVQPLQEITILAGTYYFSVDTPSGPSVIDCNGIRLQRNFNAICIGAGSDFCYMGSVKRGYKQFQLR